VGALGAAQAEKPVREDAALEKGIELVFDKLGQGGPALGFDLRHETLDVFLDQPIQDGFFGTPPLVVNWGSSRRALEHWAHDLSLVTLLCGLPGAVDRAACVSAPMSKLRARLPAR
jgi:hypothetical protein